MSLLPACSTFAFGLYPGVSERIPFRFGFAAGAGLEDGFVDSEALFDELPHPERLIDAKAPRMNGANLSLNIGTT